MKKSYYIWKMNYKLPLGRLIIPFQTNKIQITDFQCFPSKDLPSIGGTILSARNSFPELNLWILPLPPCSLSRAENGKFPHLSTLWNQPELCSDCALAHSLSSAQNGRFPSPHPPDLCWGHAPPCTTSVGIGKAISAPKPGGKSEITDLGAKTANPMSTENCRPQRSSGPDQSSSFLGRFQVEPNFRGPTWAKSMDN